MAKSKAAPAPQAQAETPPAEVPVQQEAQAPVDAPAADAPAPEAAPAPQAQALPVGFLSVEYCGRRVPHTDGLYGTRIEWDAVGAVRLVPEDVARKMVAINHDVYREGTYSGEAEPAPQPPAPQIDHNRQELDILIQTMDKDALEGYAQLHFRQNLDKRRTVETLRQEVTRLVDQFGMP